MYRAAFRFDILLMPAQILNQVERPSSRLDFRRAFRQAGISGRRERSEFGF